MKSATRGDSLGLCFAPIIALLFSNFSRRSLQERRGHVEVRWQFSSQGPLLETVEIAILITGTPNGALIFRDGNTWPLGVDVLQFLLSNSIPTTQRH